MKIIFLDIDGVLNSRKATKAHLDLLESKYKGRAEAPLLEKMLYHLPTKQQVKLLDEVCEKTGAKIVISSTWRIGNNSLLMWNCYFAALGFRWARIIGFTPTPSHTNRGEDIQAWLDKNSNIEIFAILDDDDDMAHLKDHLIQTKNSDGLTEKEANMLIKYLEKTNEIKEDI